MHKTILITGSTDGIGLETARQLLGLGHRVLLHGRDSRKLETIKKELAPVAGGKSLEGYVADLSRIAEVDALAKSITEGHASLDVLINNAGVFKTTDPLTTDGMDVRFVVNTLAPYLLTRRLLPLMGAAGRVINLSSAAQSPVNLEALSGSIRLPDDFDAYAQSKLAITAWSRHLAQTLKDNGPAIIAVNPGSLLATKMVKEGFGMPGKDINIGAQILVRAALGDEFGNASGKYFDNDSGQFALPHHDALDARKCAQIVDVVERVLAEIDSRSQ